MTDIISLAEILLTEKGIKTFFGLSPDICTQMIYLGVCAIRHNRWELFEWEWSLRTDEFSSCGFFAEAGLIP